MRARIHLDLAQLYWARVNLEDQRPPFVVQKDIDETIKYADLALGQYTKDNGLVEYQQAARIRRNAEAKAKSVAASTDTAAAPD
jgi:hypothetical protein